MILKAKIAEFVRAAAPEKAGRSRHCERSETIQGPGIVRDSWGEAKALGQSAACPGLLHPARHEGGCSSDWIASVSRVA
jgi:hypothetical protein